MVATLGSDHLLNYSVVYFGVFPHWSWLLSAANTDAVLTVRTDINPPSANVNMVTLLCPHLFHLLLIMPITTIPQGQSGGWCKAP
jgi:hypothetical protein